MKPSKAGSNSTSARGYGWQHQKARKAALASFVYGQPCARCKQPIYSAAGAELDHDDDDRTRYIGLSHAYCNERAGGQKTQRQQAPREPKTSEFGFWDEHGRWNMTSRDW